MANLLKYLVLPLIALSLAAMCTQAAEPPVRIVQPR